jgi:simple sugar transport system permease protein
MENIKSSNPTQKVFSVLSKVIPPLIGILICIALIYFFSNNAEEALESLFLGSFNSPYYFGAFLTQAGFLLLAGTGAAFAYKSGNMNLGGEGQIYLGGFSSCMILIFVKGNPLLIFLLALAASLLSGALMAGFSAFLKEKRNALPLLTSFLLSSAVIPLIDGLIMATKSNSSTNMLSLPYIDEVYRLKHILQPSPLTISIFVSFGICFLSWLIFTKSKFGKEMAIWGISEEFARYSGFSSKKNSYLSLYISGALHGLTGFFAVTGSYYTCHKDFYLGMGWNALNVTLLASSNPLLLIPFSLFLGWLYSSADRVALTQGFGFDISAIIQGVVLFTTAIPLISKKILSARKEVSNHE